MNNEVKSMWVSALRSGEYTKTTGVLCKNDLKTGELCFCALGVLCNLWHNTVGKDMGSEGWQHVPYKTIYQMGQSTGSLPWDVREWAGLNEQDPRIVWIDSEGFEAVATVSEFNDTHNKTFLELADLIEQYL